MFSGVSIARVIKIHLYIILVFFIVLAGVSLRSSYSSRDNFVDSGMLHQRIKMLDDATNKLMTIRGDMMVIINTVQNNHQIKREWYDDITKNEAALRKTLNDWVREKKSGEQAQRLSEQGSQLMSAILKDYDRYLKEMRADVSEMDETDRLIDRLNAVTLEYSDVSNAAVEKYQTTAADLHSTLIVMLVVILLIFILLYFSLSRFISKGILSKLTEATTVFAAISKGELCTSVPQYGRNEIGQLFSSIESMRVSLVDTIASVKEAVERIKLNAVEIAEGNNDLSSRTEEQASALQQTAASMEQIKTTVENNTSHAREANNLANDTKEIANSGSVVMADVVHAMETIAGHASQISQIINVIDGIASQTNILALNAAVEAARAGEQGRGFAVVATEVRHLAQRSAEAAKEIRGLIEHSVMDTNAGGKRVASAKETMTEIVEMVSRVSGIMQDIALASEEQNIGIRQVSVAINEMDVVTQQNASLVEESAAITARMDEQTSQLGDMVSVFKLSR